MKFREIRQMSKMEVRSFCRRNRLYTMGTNDDYERLMKDISDRNLELTLEDIEVIAKDILDRSDVEAFGERTGICGRDEQVRFVMTSLINDCCITYIVSND